MAVVGVKKRLSLLLFYHVRLVVWYTRVAKPNTIIPFKQQISYIMNDVLSSVDEIGFITVWGALYWFQVL